MRGVENARELRRLHTEAEAKLWWRLRDRRLGGWKFRRQHPIGPFVVDFVCLERRLIVELDGGQHVERIRYDDSRTAWLSRRGYTVVRYWNDAVLLNLDCVLDDLRARSTVECAAPLTPTLSPCRGEGGVMRNA